VCAPSRACLATGREYDDNQVPSNDYDVPVGLVTAQRALRDVGGYHVMVSGKDDLTKHSGYGQDGSHRAAELGYSAWRGRTPGKAGTYKARAGPFPAFLANQTVTWQGREVSALAVHDACYNALANGSKLPPTKLACCLGEGPRADGGEGKTEVCSTAIPHVLPDAWYEDNWVGGEALAMLADSPAGKPWFMQVNWPVAGMNLQNSQTAWIVPEPFNYTPMAVNSISSGSPHVRPMGRTCGEPDEIKKDTHPKYITALFRERR